MTTADWLLMFHITSAFLLVGGSTMAAICSGLAMRSELPSEAAFLLRMIKLALPFIFAGVAGTFIFGIWLWHELGFGIGTGWIWASLVFWVAASALGGAGGKHQEKARELAERLAAAGDTTNDELRALLRDPKGNALSWAAGAATITILVLMVWKPGS